jgi:hypothetical protein
VSKCKQICSLSDPREQIKINLSENVHMLSVTEVMLQIFFSWGYLECLGMEKDNFWGFVRGFCHKNFSMTFLN